MYINNEKVFKEVQWKKITLGQIVKVTQNTEIPADLLVIKSSNENGFCYLQTSNLDGETNLKPREAINYLQNSIHSEDDLEIYGTIEIDNPNKNIYCINGCINQDNKDKIYFDISNCILRGGILKNVKYVYGIVIYTGKETKIMENIKKGKQKLSSLDKLLNTIVLIFLVFAVIITVLFTSIGIAKMTNNLPKPEEGILGMDYVYYKQDTGNKVLDGIRTFFGFFNIFASLIPISIMIALEVVKSLQTLILSMEEGYGVGDEKKKFLSLKLHENLGNIKYIFTDKTGTLTRNEMKFKGCSIFTKLYCPNDTGTTMYETRTETTTGRSIFSKDFNAYALKESLENDGEIEISATKEECPFSTLREITLEYFLNIALNHNVLVDVDDNNNNNNSSYSGSNPDEVVLVEAAKEVGVEFIERIGDQYTVRVNGEISNFTLLNRFDFTSERKRSSIIIRDSNNRIKMYMKGADNVILKKIDEFSFRKLLATTNEHVDKFSKQGLRTLCYSMRFLSLSEYDTFNKQYQSLQSEYLIDKSKIKEIEELISSLENNMLLLGVSALEDMLQDNVKGCIKDFIDANINVWMLTGDKLDTAESIGYSCRLLTDDTEVFKIKEKNKDNITEILQKIKEETTKKYNDNKEEEENEIKKEQIELGVIHKDCEDEGMTTRIRRRRSRSIQLNNKITFQSQIMSQANEQNQIIKFSKNSILSNYEPKKKQIERKGTHEFQQKFENNICIQVDSSNTISNNVIETNQKEIPNDNSILKYMVNKNFFNEDSFKDGSLSFIKSIKKKKKSELDINQMKEKFKNDLKNFEIDNNEENNQNIQFSNYAVIIEGEALEICLQEKNRTLFYDCLSKCRSVICSRCAPIQKSQVVDFIKRQSKQMTLAIGDGGNDVNMLHTADIGVGIFGKEGSQAAYSSDYAFSQFKYLRKLLFTFGRYSAMRNSYFVNFFFFKNILYTFIQFFYSIDSFLSGCIFYDNFYLLGYNSFLTTFQPCIYALFEEDIDISFNSSKKKEVSKMLVPDLYRDMRDHEPFSLRRFIFTIIAGFVMSIFCYYIPSLGYRYISLTQSGRVGSLADVSGCAFWSMCITSYLSLLIDSYFFNSWSFGLHGIQVVILVVFPFIQNLFEQFLIGGKFYDIVGNIKFWLILLASIMFNIMLFYIVRSFERFFTNNIVTRVRTNDIEMDIQKKICLKKLIEAQKYERCLNKFKKVYKMDNNLEAENYVDKKIKDYVDKFKSAREAKEGDVLIRKVNEHGKHRMIRKETN